MNTAKNEAQSLLQRLPDTCTLEDFNTTFM
jgi:hypothetical protein